MDRPSRRTPRMGRRDLLRLTALLPLSAVVAAGCTAQDKPPDPLVALARAARADAVLARVAAESGVTQAEAVAQARREHAKALQREIDRIDPPEEDAPPPRDPAAPPAPNSAAAAKQELTEAMGRSGKQAADLVAELPAHRAGLVGSVSASCASLQEVLA